MCLHDRDQTENLVFSCINFFIVNDKINFLMIIDFLIIYLKTNRERILVNNYVRKIAFSKLVRNVENDKIV